MGGSQSIPRMLQICSTRDKRAGIHSLDPDPFVCEQILYDLHLSEHFIPLTEKKYFFSGQE